MGFNKKILLLIVCMFSFLMAGCGKRGGEAATKNYEHTVQLATPTPTIEPTKEPPKEPDDVTGLDSDDPSEVDDEGDDPDDLSSSGVVEIDGMVFTSVNDTVKVIASKARLRKEPSTDSPEVVMAKAGDCFTRTAIGDSGWDQLQYQGETVYIWNEYIEKDDNVNKVESKDVDIERILFVMNDLEFRYEYNIKSNQLLM